MAPFKSRLSCLAIFSIATVALMCWIQYNRKTVPLLSSDESEQIGLIPQISSPQAYATMLTSNQPIDDLNNEYFISARLLVSRLIHHPQIRTTMDVISYIYLITSSCDREYIEKDAKDIRAGWSQSPGCKDAAS
jgi:hypothetical protein